MNRASATVGGPPRVRPGLPLLDTKVELTEPTDIIGPFQVNENAARTLRTGAGLSDEPEPTVEPPPPAGPCEAATVILPVPRVWRYRQREAIQASRQFWRSRYAARRLRRQEKHDEAEQHSNTADDALRAASDKIRVAWNLCGVDLM